jgi:hypothetical protein
MDNHSNDQATIDFLHNVKNKVILNETNNGPWIRPDCNKDIYDIMPDKFIITDPDLEFNKDLPNNFIEIMCELSDKYNTKKIGFALSLEDADDMIDNNDYFYNMNICEWEKQFWDIKIIDNDYELYQADMDTTFCLINKYNSNNTCIRIGNNFAAKHLPWYIKHDILNMYEKYTLYSKQTCISTVSKITVNYINKTYKIINKNDIFVLLENTDPYIYFWENAYSNYENDKFILFDKYIDLNKIVIDIGNELAFTSIYLSKKSKNVYSIMMNNNISTYFENIISINAKNIELLYGNNNISNVIDKYCKQNQIAFINVDIYNSENLLTELYDLHITTKIPIIVTINYLLWKNKDLGRFSFLSLYDIEKIKMCDNYTFCYN